MKCHFHTMAGEQLSAARGFARGLRLIQIATLMYVSADGSVRAL